MPRPTKEPPIASAIVPSIAKMLSSRGVHVASLAIRFGLSEDVELRESVLAAADVPNELLEIAERVDPNATFALAEDLSGGAHTLTDVAVRSSASLAEALSLQARATVLVHEGLEAVAEETGGVLRFVVRSPRRPRGVGRHVHELAVALAVHRARRAIDERITPARVWFAHARPRDTSALAGFFGACAFDFGLEDSGFELAEPFPSMKHADAKSAAEVGAMLAERITPPASFASRVARHVADALPSELAAAAIADAMHMSARTLQRRLEGEGTTLGDVVQRARRELAERLLEDATIPLGEIAARVGFSELATFSRAFKRWTGKPPGQWRRS